MQMRSADDSTRKKRLDKSSRPPSAVRSSLQKPSIAVAIFPRKTVQEVGGSAALPSVPADTESGGQSLDTDT